MAQLTPQDFGLPGRPEQFVGSDGKVQMLYMQPDAAGYGRAVSKDVYDPSGIVPDNAQNANLYMDYLKQQQADTPPSPQGYGSMVLNNYSNDPVKLNDAEAKAWGKLYPDAHIMQIRPDGQVDNYYGAQNQDAPPSPYRFFTGPDWQAEETRMGKPFMQTYESARASGLPKDAAWTVAMQARDADQKQQETVSKMNLDVWKTQQMYPADRFGPDSGRDGSGAKPYFQFAGIDPNTGERIIFDARTGNIAAAPEGKGALNPKTRKAASAAQQESLANIDTLTSQIEQLEKLYNPRFVGAADARTGGVTSYFGLTDPKGRPGQESLFRKTLQTIQNDYIFGTGGKALTGTELGRLIPALVDSTDSEVNFQANLKRVKELLATSKANRSRVMQETGAIAPGEAGMKASMPAGGGKNNYNTMSDADLLKALGVK
jgi:hypothetical protein